MELKQLFSVVVRWWWLVALPAVIAFVLALPSLRNVISPPVTYTVGVRFTASQPPPADNNVTRTFEDQSYIPWLTSEYVVINLASWLTTETFARETANVLKAEGKAFDVNAIRGSIRADSVRSIMTLYINWPDAAELEQIANAAVRALREQSQKYFPQLSAQKVEITQLDAVIVAPVAAGITERLGPLLRILIGLAAGIGLAFLADYLDPTLRGRHEVESLLNLPVIAEIPPHRR